MLVAKAAANLQAFYLLLHLHSFFYFSITVFQLFLNWIIFNSLFSWFQSCLNTLNEVFACAAFCGETKKEKENWKPRPSFLFGFFVKKRTKADPTRQTSWTAGFVRFHRFSTVFRFVFRFYDRTVFKPFQTGHGPGSQLERLNWPARSGLITLLITDY